MEWRREEKRGKERRGGTMINKKGAFPFFVFIFLKQEHVKWMRMHYDRECQ